MHWCARPGRDVCARGEDMHWCAHPRRAMNARGEDIHSSAHPRSVMHARGEDMHWCARPGRGTRSNAIGMYGRQPKKEIIPNTTAVSAGGGGHKRY